MWVWTSRTPMTRLLVVAAGPSRRAAALLARQGLLAFAFHGGLLVVRAPLHLLEDAVLEHLLLERLQGGLDLVVEHLDLHRWITRLPAALSTTGPGPHRRPGAGADRPWRRGAPTARPGSAGRPDRTR